MDKPIQNSDGSTDIYFGPKSPGTGKNWIATVPGRGWFTLLRLYGPTKAFFDQTWKPDDIKKISSSSPARCDDGRRRLAGFQSEF